MPSILKNWMTTIPGILMFLNVAWRVYQTKTITQEDIAEVLAAFGFMGAKDFDVTGGNRQA
jgi:hypothetical protein